LCGSDASEQRDRATERVVRLGAHPDRPRTA
jgi:hypothetical protein